MTPSCPMHGPLRVEDHERDYGQTLWSCRRCPFTARTGPSDAQIMRAEQPSTVPDRVRSVAEQLEGQW